MSTTLFLIRHGESQSNVGQRTDDIYKVCLTDRGKHQAIDIARKIENKPDVIIFSPYVRTEQTAVPLLKKYPDVMTELWPLQEFTYLCPEKYSGTTRDERRSDKQVFWHNSVPDYVDGTGAESYFDFLDRVEQAIEKLKEYSGSVVIFTHGHVIRTIIWYVLLGRLNRDKNCLQRYSYLRKAISIPNGAIIQINVSEKSMSMSSIMTEHLSEYNPL